MAFAAITLALTFPFWITVNYLGEPDNGIILAGYVGSLLMAAGFLAVGSFISALTKNQVIAFVTTTAVCFVLIASGAPIVLNFFSGWAPTLLVEFIASLSFLTHFADISKGVIDLRDLVYFGSVIAVFLFANMLAGHTLIKVIAGFIAVLGVFGVLPFALVVALTGLEILIAFLQAYVFAILTCLYINDALHLH